MGVAISRRIIGLGFKNFGHFDRKVELLIEISKT